MRVIAYRSLILKKDKHSVFHHQGCGMALNVAVEFSTIGGTQDFRADVSRLYDLLSC